VRCTPNPNAARPGPPRPAQVFVYLAELHQKKLQAGQLNQPQGGPSGHRPPATPERGGFSGGAEAGEDKARTVTVAPSKVRTGGKKSLKDKMTACSIL
jgi:Ras-related protein Rab-23